MGSMALNFRGMNFWERKFLQEESGGRGGREFLQLFVGALPSELLALPKEDSK